MKVEYIVEVKEGFKPVMESEQVNEIRFVIEAKCYAEANRMVKQLFKLGNIEEICSVCIE